MGNQPSVEEQPRKGPQKLSKPRVGNHASSTNNLLSPNAAASSTARFSNSYLVGPPATPVHSPEAALSPSPRASPTLPAGAISPGPIDDQIEEKSKRRSSLFRSSTLQVESTSKRKSSSGSTGLATSKTFDGITRPKSVVQRADLSPLSPALGEQVTRRASCLDLPSHDRRAVSPKSPTAASPVAGEFNFDDSVDPARRDSNQQALNALLGRSQSEVSLHAPSRRRSAVLTPGVATRSEQPKTSLSTKKSFRKSLPTNERPRRGSHEPLPERPVSMFPTPQAADTPERLATPSESDYKQLGGMKFGSLRITNGVPSPGPESGHSTKNPLSIDKSRLSHVEAPGEIRHPQPVSPALATFSDTSTVGLATSDEKDFSPFSAPPTGSLTVESISPAAHSSIQTTPEEDEKSQLANPEKAQPESYGSPQRSDSGSGSAGSGNSSGPSSKSDSGYGSSLSLRSLFGSRKKSQRGKAAKTEAEPVPAETPERRPTLKQQEAYEPLAKKKSRTSLKSEAAATAASNPSSETPESQARTGIFNSFKARKARKEGKPTHNRGSSVPDFVSRQVSADKTKSATGENNGGQKAKKLQKLSDDGRRRSLPAMTPANDAQETVPSMPSDAGEKVQEHTRNFDMAHKRFSLRLAADKNTPRPVVVESKEVIDLPLHHVDGSNTSDLVEPVSPQPRGMSRAASVISRQPSIHTNRRSILRKPRPAPKESADSGDEDDLPDYILGVEAQAASIASIRHSAGNSAFDAAFVPMAEDHAIDTNVHRRLRQSRSRPRTPEGQGPYPRLRSRSSAPDFLETVSEPASPGSISCYSQKKPKTPPPISIRTRGSKKKRRSKSRHLPPQQHPPMPGQFGVEGVRGGLDSELGQSLRSFPLSHHAMSMDPRNQVDVDVPYNRRASARPFYQSQSDLLGPYPAPHRAPAFHRPYPRPMDAQHQSPGRVLHSYNSPAYKGVPIWS